MIKNLMRKDKQMEHCQETDVGYARLHFNKKNILRIRYRRRSDRPYLARPCNLVLRLTTAQA